MRSWPRPVRYVHRSNIVRDTPVPCFFEHDSLTPLARRASAEALGTLLLTVAALGAASLAAGFAADSGSALIISAIATSTALVSLIVALGPVSGGHFNPLITMLQWLGGHAVRIWGHRHCRPSSRAVQRRPTARRVVGIDPGFAHLSPRASRKGDRMMKTEEFMRALLAVHPDRPPQMTSMQRPEPGPGEALVRIEASGINPLDLKILAGAAAHARHPLPAVLGLDLAGRVIAVGEGVTHLRVHDEVFGLTGGVGGIQGSLAEYAAVDASLLAIRPRKRTARQAAAVPLVFITAWEGLVDRARITAGQTVLIHGGAGGVGHAAVQLAVAKGARVCATGSAHDRNYIEKIGASFIDYRAESVQTYVERLTAGTGFDVVYDTVGGNTLDASFSAVRIHGHVVSALGWGVHALAPLSFRGASYSGVFTLLPLLSGEGRDHFGEILRHARHLIERGQFMPRVDPREFSLSSVAEAYELIRGRTARGKVVVNVGDL